MASLGLIEIKNPFIGSITLVVITIILILEIRKYVSQWISYLLMLLFLGGIIILFLYVTSIITSLKFNLNIKPTYKWFFILLIPVAIIPNYIFLDKTNKFTEISRVFNMDRFVFIVLAIFYLLLGLVAVVRICKKHEGALKSKIND